MNTVTNRVQLIGNLGQDPEVKNFGNNRKMALMRLATTDSYRRADGKKIANTQWHTVVAWGQLAGIAERYLTKGSRIAVEGKLAHRSYQNKSGNKKYVTEIVAGDLLMLDAKKE